MGETLNRLSGERGQTTVEYGLMVTMALVLLAALAAALGFFPDFVVNAVEAAIP